jgi:hypothetical protein
MVELVPYCGEEENFRKIGDPLEKEKLHGLEFEIREK